MVQWGVSKSWGGPSQSKCVLDMILTAGRRNSGGSAVQRALSCASGTAHVAAFALSQPHMPKIALTSIRGREGDSAWSNVDRGQSLTSSNGVYCALLHTSSEKWWAEAETDATRGCQLHK